MVAWNGEIVTFNTNDTAAKLAARGREPHIPKRKYFWELDNEKFVNISKIGLSYCSNDFKREY